MMCVTVLASHPSVSMETETTQRMSAPSLPARPTVFITSRRMSASVSLSMSRGSLRLRRSFLKSAISPAASSRNSPESASPAVDLLGVD